MEIDIDQMTDIVKSIIDKYDPIELLIIGAPKDEYLQEAKLIAERIYQLRSIFKIRTIIKEVFMQQFNVELKRVQILQISNDIRASQDLYEFFNEINSNTHLNGKISIDEFSIVLKIHDYFIIKFTEWRKTYINGKFYQEIDDQDLINSYVDFATTDTVYVQYKHKHLHFPSFKPYAFFREIRKSKFDISKLKHKDDIEIIFDKDGVIHLPDSKDNK